MFRRFLSTANADRVQHSLSILQRHGIQGWALTGGLAIEIHRARLGRDLQVRQLNDIDFVTTSLACIPDTLVDDFLFRHVHPYDPPDKTIAQLVDAAVALRIDVLRTSAKIMSRATEVRFPGGMIRIVSLEDLLARATRLTLALADGFAVPSKHARDFLTLLTLAQPADVEEAWLDHRRAKDPAKFREAATLLSDLIPRHRDLLIAVKYSQEPAEQCQRCVPIGRFQLADPALVLSILGYC